VRDDSSVIGGTRHSPRPRAISARPYNSNSGGARIELNLQGNAFGSGSGGDVLRVAAQGEIESSV